MKKIFALLLLVSFSANAVVTFGKSPSGSTLWSGLSTDTKPTVSNGLGGTPPSPNDLFFETDTNKQYIYIQGAWTSYAPIYGSGGGSGGTPTTGSAHATTNDSTTITTGGTFQQIQATTTSRLSVEVQNICGVGSNCTTTANNCYVYFGTTGSASKTNSTLIPPYGDYLRSNGTIPSDAINVTCDGTADHIMVTVQ
jgi:hypothetical protein